MDTTLDQLARDMHAYVESDGTGFRRAARVLQSLWRQRAGLPMGDHNGKPLGSRLPTEMAERELANYLTPGIREVVREVLGDASESQLFSKPRIYNDLLSSQPLCFNLFGELTRDLDLATRVFRALRSDSIGAVTSIGFEYSPGRSTERFTNDRSAFDVFVQYDVRGGGRGFLGIEVKYHENLKEPAAPHRKRYDEIATSMGCFDPTKLVALRTAPLQQLWRDHLLAGTMLADPALGYTEGAFVMLSPAANTYCRSAVSQYRQCLHTQQTFDAWTLEDVVSVLALHTQAPWVEDLRRRYLDFTQLWDTNGTYRPIWKSGRTRVTRPEGGGCDSR